MEESQRPEPGRIDPGFGYRKRLRIFFTLAVIAGGFFSLWSANQPSGQSVSPAAYACGSPQLENCAATDFDNMAERQSATAATSRNHAAASVDAEGPTVVLQSKGYLRGPRSWQKSSPDGSHLRPGYTVAELCAMDGDTSSLRCRISGADERPQSGNYQEADAAAGHIIAGHVLTADGAGLAGIAIVASPKRLAGADQDAAGNMRFWTMSDASGAYTLSGIPKGLYTIRSGNQGL
jgi:hypothetical protein